MGFFEKITDGIGRAIGGLAGGILGIPLENHNDQRQLEQQAKLNEQQLGIDLKKMEAQKNLDLEMWEKTNYGAQKAQMIKAGLNPALMYGMGGGGGTTTGSGGASVNAPNAAIGGAEIMGMMMQKMQLDMMKAQIEKTEAEKTKIETETFNITEDTTLKQLEQVIKDYTGREMKAQWNIKEAARGKEAEMWANEVESRAKTAKILIELYKSGDLWNKSIQEIQSIIVNNSKQWAEVGLLEKERSKREQEIEQIKQNIINMKENLKGIKLDNIIKDLEKRLQTTTGIDSNSPGWLKVLGRLFVEIIGKE